MEVSITLIFWIFYYAKGSMHMNDFTTYVHPIFLYILPAIALVIETCLNSISFAYLNVIYLVAIYIIYVPFTYLGRFALGYYPYSFVTWSDWNTYLWIFSNLVIQVVVFFVIALLNNYVKSRYSEETEQSEVFTIDRGIHYEV